VRYYHPVVTDDVVGIVHLQGGTIEGFGGSPLRISDEFDLGPSLVRGFAPGGIGPRDISDPTNNDTNGLGGSHYVGASLEVQFPIWGLPRDIGLKGALFTDAGTLFGYSGQTNFAGPGGACAAVATSGAGQGLTIPNPKVPNSGFQQGNCIDLRDNAVIRSSVGASLIWASPLGPIRFDYAYATSKDKFDVTQAFRFSGGTSF
jgi:outer membrane protein insertion porin family